MGSGGGRDDGGGGGGGGDGDAPPARVFLSGNLATYWREKTRAGGGGDGGPDARESAAEAEAEADNGKGGWNHLTAPLSSSRPRAPPPDRAKRPHHFAPSAFSDLERSRTADGFANIFMERMGDAASSGRLARAWRSDGGVVGGSSMFSWLLTTDQRSDGARRGDGVDPDDYAAERRMVQPHFTPFVWGSACAMATLFSLRVGRWRQGGGTAGRALTMTRGANGTTGGVDRSSFRNARSLQDTRQSLRSHDGGNPFRRSPREDLKDGLMASLNTLPVDVALSMLFGISTTVFLTSPSNLMADLSRAPLLEGRSALAEELCGPFAREMERVNANYHTYAPYNAGGDGADDDLPAARRRTVSYAELWRDENLGEFDGLRAVRDFVRNCRAREGVARRLVGRADGGGGDADEGRD